MPKKLDRLGGGGYDQKWSVERRKRGVRRGLLDPSCAPGSFPRAGKRSPAARLALGKQ